MVVKISLTLIQTVTVGAGGAASITFGSGGTLPQTYTDLLLRLNLRSTSAPSSTEITDGAITFNGANSNKSGRLLYGAGSGSGASGTYSDLNIWFPSSLATSNTFGSIDIYIPNYAGDKAKSTSHDIVTENNGTFSYQMIFAGLWNSTAAINQITIAPFSSNWAQYSSASLYGVLAGSSGGVTVS